MIGSDISRCNGMRDVPICQQCARRQQIEIDDATRWYPYMPPAVTIDGRCSFYIKAEGDSA